MDWFTKIFIAGIVACVALIGVCVVFAVKSDNACKASGGHTVTTTTYGYRYTPGTTKWEYGPIINSTCEK
jgi:hypothetical protein